MPLSSVRKDGGDKERTAKSQEQELKRARGAISCAECRRLKLKCDKTVPCSSCKRRGCASICPNGSLTTGQGTRFILADTDRLHRKIAEMSDRIRHLEDGLAILQSSVTRDPHPLLAQDLLKIKSGLELHSAAEGISAELPREYLDDREDEPAYVDAFGTLAVRDDGAATFYGRSAGSESLLLDDKPSLTISTLSRPSTGHPELSVDVNRLASSFPHGPPEFAVYDLKDIIQEYLPPWPRARQLRDLYLEQAPWFFGAVTHRQLYDEVFPLFYEEAAEEARSRITNGFVGSADAFHLPIPSTTHASSHELALMLVVFCFGALTDATLPPAPHNTEAEKYYQLTRAALSLEPVMDRPPSVATVQVLSLMGIYQGMVADEHSIETTWALMGLSSKLAQSAGLHRDCSRFKLSAAETQKRRALFWELFITDCWQALATGRLPTFELQFVDTELPGDPDETLADDGTPQPSFPAWKARWGKECVSGVVMGTLTAQPPKYSVILDLDRRLRDMPLPRYAQGPPPQNAGLAQTMSHYMPTNYLHLTLLYVHRVFFARALVDHPTDPMRSQYAPSFLAGYRSASALLMTLREQFAIFPTQIARFWVLWTHAFSACVMMGSVVTRGGTTKTAQAALGELRAACDLFERASKHGGRACKFVPILRKLHEKAQAAYFQGLHPLRRDIFAPRTAETEHDELSIFSGRTPRTVATKSNRPQRISPSMSASSASASASGAASDHSSPGSQNGSEHNNQNARSSQSPSAEAFPGLDSSHRTAVHPGLVAELRSFEGQLEAQISQASSYVDHGRPYVYGEAQLGYGEAQLGYGEPQQAYGEVQQGYEDQQQQAYGDHQQVLQQDHQQDPHASWYHANVGVEHSQPSAASSPLVPGPPQQQQQQQPQSYPVQYTHSQPGAQGHSPEHQHQHQNQHPPSHRHSYIQPSAASESQFPPQAQAQAQAQATPTALHPHDVPVYGGAYSNGPSHPHAHSHYQDHPYAHVAANASAQSLHEYAAYPAHHHSVPDQRSELWTVNVPAEENEGPYQHQHQNQNQNQNQTQHEHEHAPIQHAPGYDVRGEVLMDAADGDEYAHHAARFRHGHGHGHNGHHAGVPPPHPQPQPQPQPPASAQAQPQPPPQPQALQPQHTGGHAHRPHPQPLQPQHTGHAHAHAQHPGHAHHHPGADPYAQAQAQQYAFNPHDPHAAHRPQPQMMAPPAPGPPGPPPPPHSSQPSQAHQQHPQVQAPLSVLQSGYSLQETWTTFFQQELPVPPGRR